MSEKENTKSSSSEGSTAAPTQAAAAKAAATKLNIAAKEFVPGKGFGVRVCLCIVQCAIESREHSVLELVM